MFWAGGVESGSVAYRCLKESIFWEEGVDYERVISRGGGVFWEGGVDSGRAR